MCAHWLRSYRLPWSVRRNSAPAVEGANLVLTQSDSPDPVTAGMPSDLYVRGHQSGPLGCHRSGAHRCPSAGVIFSSASPGCTYNSSSREVGCAVGSLANGASVSITITVVPTAPGTLTNTGAVSAAETDPAPSNNSAQVQTTVLRGCPCSIWSDSSIPVNPAVSEGLSLEVGVKFRGRTWTVISPVFASTRAAATPGLTLAISGRAQAPAGGNHLHG